MRTFGVCLIVAVVFLALFIFPIQSARQTTQIISSQGIVDAKDGNLSWLHTDGKYIKDEFGNNVLLRGCCLGEVPAYVDHLKNNDPMATRVARLKELGVNHVRLPVQKADWDANRDANGDDIGARDFNYQVIDAFTEAGIYVFVGLHYGVNISEEQSWAADPQIMVDWYVDNIIDRYRNNAGVNIYVWNEPHYGQWGGSDLGGGLYSGYWNAMKQVCQAIHNANPNILMIVHANTQGGFCPVLQTDPIPVPNVVYTWHYYYCYAPIFDPYMGWMTGVLDPTYQYLANLGMPFYQSYYLGNYAKAHQEFEQWLYDAYLWVPTELNLPIINDEFGFNGDEESYGSNRACTACLEANGGVPQSGVTFWKIVDTLDSPGGNRIGDTYPSGPYPDVTYCPRCGAAIPRPREQFEPGWPQCMRDFIEIMEKYACNWNYFPWWVKVYGGYGLCTENSMMELGKVGEVWKDCLNS